METIRVKNGYRLTADEILAIIGRAPDGIYFRNGWGFGLGAYYIADLKRKSAKPKASDIAVQSLALVELSKDKITEGKKLAWNSKELANLTEEYFTEKLADEKQLLIIDDSNRYFFMAKSEDSLYGAKCDNVLYQSPRLLEVTKAIVQSITKDVADKLKERAYLAKVKNLVNGGFRLNHHHFQVIDEVDSLIWSSLIPFMKVYNFQKFERLAKGEQL